MTLAFPLTAAKHHACEQRVILGRREEAAIAESGPIAAQQILFFKTRIVDVDQASLLLLARFYQFRKLPLHGIKRCILHSQGMKQPLIEELVKRDSADDLHHPAQAVDTGLAILPLRARFETQWL